MWTEDRANKTFLFLRTTLHYNVWWILSWNDRLILILYNIIVTINHNYYLFEMPCSDPRGARTAGSTWQETLPIKRREIREVNRTISCNRVSFLTKYRYFFCFLYLSKNESPVFWSFCLETASKLRTILIVGLYNIVMFIKKDAARQKIYTSLTKLNRLKDFDCRGRSFLALTRMIVKIWFFFFFLSEKVHVLIKREYHIFFSFFWSYFDFLFEFSLDHNVYRP